MSFFKKTSTKQRTSTKQSSYPNTNKHRVLQTTVPTESFEPSEARLIDNYFRDLRRWQWYSDTNNDGRILRNDMVPPKNPPNPGQIPWKDLNNVTPYPNKVTLISADDNHYWDGYDVTGDGHCFYHVLHRFLLQNELYPPDKQIQFDRFQWDGQSDVKNADGVAGWTYHYFDGERREREPCEDVSITKLWFPLPEELAQWYIIRLICLGIAMNLKNSYQRCAKWAWRLNVDAH